jgi:hypothetical protein
MPHRALLVGREVGVEPLSLLLQGAAHAAQPTVGQQIKCAGLPEPA